MRGKKEKVKYLISIAPDLVNNPSALLLLYWKIFDGINVPNELINEVAVKATPPESVLRFVRFALADLTTATDRKGS